MPKSCFSGETVDDVMRMVIEEIIASGTRINPTQGACTELVGLLVEITNPRARLSLTETRGRPISCLGEFCWYLAGSNDLAFVQYYIPQYAKHAEDGCVVGGYGPRLFDWRGSDQVDVVTKQLKEKRDSRQAVIQIFDSSDLVQKHRSIPCTCTLQFFLRRDRLHMLTSMRSNDVYLGLPHDVFAFTMLQEIIARDLEVEVGTYKHAVGSMHLYDRNRDAADKFLMEGWQSTKNAMPPMPLGNPWPAIHLLLEAEKAIRTGSTAKIDDIEALDDYWADLIRLLQVLHYANTGDVAGLQSARASMAWTPYRAYIDKRIAALEDKLE
jgi:thymidylate synthase